MWRVCNLKGVGSLLAIKMLTSLGSGLFHAIFALVRYPPDPLQTPSRPFPSSTIARDPLLSPPAHRPRVGSL
eukprot:1194781-Prorocentrum_minimum.AAC.8